MTNHAAVDRRQALLTTTGYLPVLLLVGAAIQWVLLNAVEEAARRAGWNLDSSAVMVHGIAGLLAPVLALEVTAIYLRRVSRSGLADLGLRGRTIWALVAGLVVAMRHAEPDGGFRAGCLA